MSRYIEYGVTLTDRQKSKLASAIRNNSPLTLRIKHSHLRGSDELMLTQRQISKIQKSITNGTGSDIKISKTQIRSSVKHGGNLFGALASLGAKVLPYAIKGVSKAAPALATGALSALGDIGLKKIFGNGITIPKKFFPMLPMIKPELLKSQIDLINKLAQSGKRVYIKPTPGQIQGGFLGTLASIGIPMAISLLPKLFGRGLQVDTQMPINTANVYVPRGGSATKTLLTNNINPYTRYPYQSPPFIGSWDNPIGMGIKKKKSKKGRGLLLGKNSPFNSIPILGDIL